MSDQMIGLVDHRRTTASAAEQGLGSHLSEQAWSKSRSECEPSVAETASNMAFFAVRDTLVGLAAGARFGARGAAVGLALGFVSGLRDGQRITNSDEFECVNKHLLPK